MTVLISVSTEIGGDGRPGTIMRRYAQMEARLTKTHECAVLAHYEHLVPEMIEDLRFAPPTIFAVDYPKMIA